MNPLQATNYNGTESIAFCALASGFFPIGLRLDPAEIDSKTQCAISGTPTGIGQFTIGVRATAQSTGATGVASLTININSPAAQNKFLAIGGVSADGSSSVTKVEAIERSTGFLATPTYPDLPSSDSSYTGWIEPAGVRLPDGSILVAGGRNDSGQAQGLAYRLVPSLNTWQAVGALNVPRYGHTMTVIPWSGEVVVVGGSNSVGAALNSVEVFDPVSKVFNLRASSLAMARYGHTATLIKGANPAILILGGRASIDPSAPATNAVERIGPVPVVGWSVVTAPEIPDLPVALSFHRTTVNSTGIVMVSGGFTSAGVRSGGSYVIDSATFSEWSSAFAMGVPRAEQAFLPLYNDSFGARFMMFGGAASAQPMVEIFSGSGGNWNAFSPGNLSTNLSTWRGGAIGELNPAGGVQRFVVLGGTVNSNEYYSGSVLISAPNSGNSGGTFTEQTLGLANRRSEFIFIDF
jgi:hypothetical protein